MTALRYAAAGIAAAAALALGVSALVAVVVGGLLWIGCVYAGGALLMYRAARRIRPRRRRAGSGYLELPLGSLR